MNDVTLWKVPKWPFLLAYATLLGFAAFFLQRAPQSVHHWEIAAACVVIGTLVCVLPFYLDYRAMGKALEANALGTVAEKIATLEKLSAQISSATNHWANLSESVQTESGKTAAIAKDIADKMTDEVRRFSEFMQGVNDNEKANLRLEVEKLHRGENEWLQTVVRMLDHIYALHIGAVRTGDARFIEPISNFQNACRDTVRRLGLTPFAAEPGEPFDADRHQPAGNPESIPADAVVGETVGAGYTFQGKLLRPALVRLHEAAPAVPPIARASDELPL
jgi:molecular chaperone GrpE (heat shock protein)